MPESGTVLHLLPLASYQAEAGQHIGSPTLGSHGFLHCSPDAATTLAVANALYPAVTEPMVAIELDTGLLSAPLRWEAAQPGPPPGVDANVLFPHLYGPINRNAITRVYLARRDCAGRYVALEPYFNGT